MQGLRSYSAHLWALEKVGEVGNYDFLPALSVGDPQECKGYTAILPSFGPLRRQG